MIDYGAWLLEAGDDWETLSKEADPAAPLEEDPLRPPVTRPGFRRRLGDLFTGGGKTGARGAAMNAPPAPPAPGRGWGAVERPARPASLQEEVLLAAAQPGGLAPERLARMPGQGAPWEDVPGALARGFLELPLEAGGRRAERAADFARRGGALHGGTSWEEPDTHGPAALPDILALDREVARCARRYDSGFSLL